MNKYLKIITILIILFKIDNLLLFSSKIQTKEKELLKNNSFKNIPLNLYSYIDLNKVKNEKNKHDIKKKILELEDDQKIFYNLINQIELRIKNIIKINPQVIYENKYIKYESKKIYDIINIFIKDIYYSTIYLDKKKYNLKNLIEEIDKENQNLNLIMSSSYNNKKLNQYIIRFKENSNFIDKSIKNLDDIDALISLLNKYKKIYGYNSDIYQIKNDFKVKIENLKNDFKKLENNISNEKPKQIINNTPLSNNNSELKEKKSFFNTFNFFKNKKDLEKLNTAAA